MTAPEFARVRRLVEAAHALPPNERLAWLERECGADAALHAEVHGILCAALEAPDLLERATGLPSVESLAPQPEADLRAGTSLGGFRILRRLASGGMGTVWEAEQSSPRRRVALKTLRFGAATLESVRRFRYEAEILARLRHPNIAQILASGVDSLSGENVPWFALEFVPGARSITDFAAAHRLDLNARLDLFATLCDAVQHGHERGVIHRDLKPSNVLVDEDGVLKVIDFGVARLIGPAAGLTTLHTEAGRVIGTLQYMSPEQFLGAGDAVDTRSDVYSLGAVLYELVTGARPHDLGSATLVEAARILAEGDPSPPSARNPRLSRDIDAVVLKALAKERAHRYPSADALAHDLRRLRTGEAVEARPPGLARQLRVLARRHRVLTGALAAVLATLVTATAVSLRHAWAAQRAREQALEERDRSRSLEYVANIAAAYGALRTNDARTALQRLESAPAELRDFEWWRLRYACDPSLWTRTLEGLDIATIAWTPDGSRLIAASHSGGFEVLDARTGARIHRRPDRPGRSWTWSLRPDGARLAAVFADGAVRVHEVEGASEVLAWTAHEQGGAALAYSPDGAWLATTGRNGEVRLWDAARGELVRELEPASASVQPLRWSPDGRRLAGGSTADGVVLVWQVEEGKLVRRLAGHRAYVSGLAFVRNGEALASASHDHDIRLWDLASGACESVLRHHDDIVWSVESDPQGRRFASASWDRTIRVWNAENRELLRVLPGHLDSAQWVSFSPDGARLASADEGPRVKVWDLSATAAPDAVPVTGKWSWSLRFFPDGASLLAIHGGVADRWATGTSHRITSYSRAGASWEDGAPLPDLDTVALGARDGLVVLFDAATGRELSSFRAGDSGVTAMEWSIGRRALLVGLRSGELRSIREDGARLVDYEASSAPIEALALRPDGEQFVTAGPLGELRLHDVASGRTLFVSEPSHAPAKRATWRADGRVAALALEDGRVRLWNAESRRFERELSGHGASVEGVRFSPDGRRIVTGGNDRTIRLWDATSGWEVAAFTDHSHFVNDVGFSPDGAWLVSGSSDSTLRWYFGGDLAQRRVESLRDQLLLRRSVLAALESDPKLGGSVRQRAIERAASLPDDPLELARSAWIVARARGSAPAELAKARAQARVARNEAPLEVLPVLALAASDLRLGDATAALAILEPFEEVGDPRVRAVRALALARLGQWVRARKELETLESSGAEIHSELRLLVEEARAVADRVR